MMSLQDVSLCFLGRFLGKRETQLQNSANHDGQTLNDRVVKLLSFISNHEGLDDARGNPHKILALVDEFAIQNSMMIVGEPKGEIVTELIKEQQPKIMIELGCYFGYSAILFGEAVRQNGGERYYSLELNPEWAAAARHLIELAELQDFVEVIVGRSDVILDKLYRDGQVTNIEIMFIDHYKPAYLTDLKQCEHHGMIVPGSLLLADNVIYPGNPPYLEYVRSTVEQKRDVAKNGPVKGYNTTGLLERTVKSWMPEGDVPFLETVGNPNIVYQSVLRQPEGERVSCF
jgi:catechol O-methyltransferase